MNIDKPLCNLKTCRHYFDGNCINDQAFARCEYANAISELAYIAPLADIWERRARKLAAMLLHKMDWPCFFCKNPMKNLEGPIVGCDGNCDTPDLPKNPKDLFDCLDAHEIDIKECPDEDLGSM